MTAELSEFRLAMERLAGGEDDEVNAGITWILTEYGDHIQEVAARRLNPRMQSKIDSEDFFQLVALTIVKHPERFSGLQTPEELVRYLARVAMNKVNQEHRKRFKSQKHNITRECSLDDPSIGSNGLTSREFTASKIVVARETRSQLTETETATARAVVENRIAGSTIKEASEIAGCHERTARKILDRLEKNMSRQTPE